MNNCGAQNKNYTLLTLLISLVNSGSIAARSITLKYLEAGHTFMSADSCHVGMERLMRRMGNICDMDDFIKCVEGAGARVIELSHRDFKSQEGNTSAAKLKRPDRPMLAGIRQFKVRHGEKVTFYKKRHADEWAQFDYLKLKAKYNTHDTPDLRDAPRGISAVKKQDIIKNLCKFMPHSRRRSWDILPTSDSNDLIDNME